MFLDMGLSMGECGIGTPKSNMFNGESREIMMISLKYIRKSYHQHHLDMDDIT
jgi:hypothetical protein